MKFHCAFAIVFFTAFMGLGCAVLHKTQISEIDNRSENALVPFEIKLSETGVDLTQITTLQRAFTKTHQAKAVGDLAALISLFQMGPRTGNPVYVEGYAKDLIYAIHTQCPSGAVTGLMSIRETREYPIISGEIIKVRGYCVRKRMPASEPEDTGIIDRDEDDI